MFPRSLRKETHWRFFSAIPGISAKYYLSQATLNLPSPSSFGIGSISIAWATDSLVKPHLMDDPGAIIPFPDVTFGLSGRFVISRVLFQFERSGLTCRAIA
jgi:hypothetical protein